MAYVNLEGVDPLRGLTGRFNPLPDRSKAIVKYGKLFTNSAGDEWLIDTVVAEIGSASGTQHFYICAKQTDRHLSLRLDPLTDPFKSPGVHESIAALARWFLKECPAAKIVKHGLNEEAAASLENV